MPPHFSRHILPPHFRATVSPFVSPSVTRHCRHILPPHFSRHSFSIRLSIRHAPQVFHEECHSIAFHPSGLHVLCGFSDKLRLMNVLVDEMRTYRFLSHSAPFLPHVRAHSSHIPPFKFFVLERCFFSLTRPHFSHMSEPILPISHLLNPSFWRGVFSSHSTPFLPHVRAHSSHISSFNFCVLESSPSRARPRAASPTAASASRRSTGTRSRCTPRTRASTWAICADTAAR